MSRTVFRQNPLAAACTAFCLLSASTTVSAEISAYLRLGTDSPYRGLWQTLSGGYAQGGLEYQFTSGFYTGVWAGRTDYDYSIARNGNQRGDCGALYSFSCGAPSPINTDTESNYFIGYQRQLSQRFSYDITLTRHAYYGSSGANSLDWNEISASLNFDGRWLLSGGASNRWPDVKRSFGYLELGYLHPLAWEISLDATLGQQYLENIIGQNLTYTEIGFSKAVKSLSLRLGYSATDRKTKRIFGSRAGDNWFASMTWFWGT
ncbi:MAG: TorF family putative porin [Exilibacterium sp.]